VHPSRFAASQLVFAHAALTDLAGRRLRHDQRVARRGFGLAEFDEADTELRLKDWTLQRDGTPASSRYRSRLNTGAGFGWQLVFTTTQAPLLQGDAGWSRKGPLPDQASRYYSQPQLTTAGTLTLGGKTFDVSGRSWLDHEWSDTLLDAEAVGWDWIGMNLDDGAALTAFRLRRADGSTLFAGGSFRRASEAPRPFAADAVRFTPARVWTSPRSAARYPVQWRVDTPAGAFDVVSLLDDQELDSRASTGAIYWEGLSELRDARGQRVGLGYLEMTGYAGALKL
jgi:predicted secreted hydrolase